MVLNHISFKLKNVLQPQVYICFRLNCGLLSMRDESPEGVGFLPSVMSSAVVGNTKACG